MTRSGCVDYRDLNKASLKDDFPLHHIDVFVDNVVKSAPSSFMDGLLGHNHIRMREEDKDKTTFITP
jgi:putative transposase